MRDAYNNALLTISALALSLVVAEIVLRVFPYEEVQTNNEYLFRTTIGKWKFQEPYHTVSERYDADLDERGYYAQSDFVVRFDFNQFGARWISATDQPLGKELVVLLGDSFTYGSGLRYTDTLAFRLEQKLRGAGRDVSFLNFGRSGADTRRALRIYRDVKGSVPPHQVVYALHLNDVVSFKTSHVTRNNLLDAFEESPVAWSKLARFVLYGWNSVIERRRKIAHLVSPEVFQRDQFISNWPALEELQKETARNGSQLLVLLLPILVDVREDTFRPVYDGILARAAASGVRVIDLTRTVRSHDDSDLWILPVDQHPNEVANELFAVEAAARIEATGFLRSRAPVQRFEDPPQSASTVEARR